MVALRLAVAAALIAAVTPSLAVVGPTAPAGQLSASVVMVLERTAGAAGFCSGVVVAADVVLTAAHCISKPADTRVHFRDDAGQSVLLDVAEIAVHPGFRADAVRARVRSIDMALVRLRQPLPGRFAPAPIGAKAVIAVGQRFRIAGFGLGREGAARTGGELRMAILAARAPLSSILLWADDPSGQGAGACTGDSGAPIFAEGDASVVALTTWAAGTGKRRCGDLTQAALIQPQMGWINGVLQRWASP